jgi:hypothetical protein
MMCALWDSGLSLDKNKIAKLKTQALYQPNGSCDDVDKGEEIEVADSAQHCGTT